MKLRLISILLFYCAGLSASGQQPTKEGEVTKPLTSPMALLQEADLISRDFVPEERANSLLELAQAANSLDTEAADRWSNELFRLTKQLKSGQFRAAMQKNALTVIAKNDPDLAAAMYSQLDPPQDWGNDLLLEDFRAYGARTLFPMLWKRHGTAAVPTIDRVAVELGSTGQYPYTAVAMVLPDIAKQNPTLAVTFFTEALSYFPKDYGFLNTNREFVQFLIRTHELVPKSLLKAGLEEAVTAIQKPRESGKKAEFHIEVSGDAGSASFNSEADYLLYKLLPLIRLVDKDWESRLRDANVALRNAPKLDVGAKLNVAGSATMPGTNASPADVRSAIDEHRLMQVEDLESSDPRQAAHVAISIADLPLRAIALSQLAASYSSIDPSQSKNWLDQSEKELEALPNGTMKLRLLVSLASSAFELRQTERGVRFMSRAFDLGEELFEEDSRANPGKMAYNLDGAEQLQKLSTIAARYLNDPTVVVQRIQEIRPDLLKATLLTSAAAGIGEARQVPQG